MYARHASTLSAHGIWMYSWFVRMFLHISCNFVCTNTFINLVCVCVRVCVCVCVCLCACVQHFSSGGTNMHISVRMCPCFALTTTCPFDSAALSFFFHFVQANSRPTKSCNCSPRVNFGIYTEQVFVLELPTVLLRGYCGGGVWVDGWRGGQKDVCYGDSRGS